jgi:hypothetical protein
MTLEEQIRALEKAVHQLRLLVLWLAAVVALVSLVVMAHSFWVLRLQNSMNEVIPDLNSLSSRAQ